MNLHEAKDEEDILESMTKMLEQESGKKIFTMRVLEHTDTGLETLVVFEDKAIMMGTIKIQTIKGNMAVRLQGNFI